MKRWILIFLCLLFAFGFACAPAANPAAEPAQTEAAVTEAPTPEPTAEPSPEPLGMAPVDLLGKGYNPFIDVSFPEGYTVYGALFNSADVKKGQGDLFSLYLTAEGEPAEIARFCAELLGITDEAAIAGYADSITHGDSAEMTGTFAGNKANAWLKRTTANEESDQCADVDGCRIELAMETSASQRAQYETLIIANMNTGMLGALADRFPQEAIRLDQISINVNLQKPNKTEVYVEYAVGDASALMNDIVAQLSPMWVDEQNQSLGIIYGRIESGFRFDFESNIVFRTVKPNDNSTPAGEFRLSDVSLTKLGFQYSEEDKFCLLEDKENGYMIAVSKPEWHRTAEDWNLMFYKDDIYMFYREDSNLFTVTVTRNDVQAGCDYNCAKSTFGEGWPSEQALQENFSGVLGGAQAEDVRAGVFAVFTDLVMQRFGMTWQELYALPIW